jgi:hypothetical protein
VKVDLLIRLGFGEPASAVRKGPEDPASDAWTRLLDDSAPLVAKLLELTLDGAKRGIDGIYKVVAVFFAVSILPGSERVTRTSSVPC